MKSEDNLVVGLGQLKALNEIPSERRVFHIDGE